MAPGAERRVVQDYVQGLQWVLQYYYRGVASWSWFYPHHYAPLASDIVQVQDMQVGPRMPPVCPVISCIAMHSHMPSLCPQGPHRSHDTAVGVGKASERTEQLGLSVDAWQGLPVSLHRPLGLCRLPRQGVPAQFRRWQHLLLAPLQLHC